MAKIAISYRRDDSLDITGRIFDRLTSRYGRGSVFRDIDSIPPGRDFREHIQKSLDDSDVLMVVVGPRWLGEERNGRQRIQSETDYVRTEVELALSRSIPVIPLLVGGSDMPEPEQLPDSIREFAYRNAVAIDSGRDFDHHMNNLIRAADGILQHQPQPAETDVEHRGASHHVPSGSSDGQRPLLLQIVGGALIALGISNVAWFTINILHAVDAGALGSSLRSVWMIADLVYAVGGLAAGIGTVLGRPWGRVAGIILCLLLCFGNALWFVENFDKELPRLIFAATGVALLLGIVGAYLYVFRWPPTRQ